MPYLIMKTYTMSKFLPIIIAAFMLSGCVSMKSYRDTKSEMLSLKYGYDDMKTQLEAIKARNATLEDEYNRLMEANETNDNTAQLEALLAERDQILSDIRSALTDALSSFEDRGLTLVQKNGKIYVMMEDKLLFESGKYNITKDGKSAIREIGSVLSEIANVDIVVEGHTDNKGLLKKKDAQIVDNWDLSCKRATEVVRVLSQSGGIAPVRIVASGRGQYYPISDNNTETGRAQNRRTEIILTPQLDKLMDLLK